MLCLVAVSLASVKDDIPSRDPNDLKRLSSLCKKQSF